jgi:hypothetical protein
VRNQLALVGALVAVASCDRFFGIGDPGRLDATSPDSPGSTVEFVHITCKDFPSGQGPYVLTIPATTGNLLVAALTHSGQSGSTVTLMDEAGDPFMLDLQQHYYREAQLLYLADAPVGTTTITTTRDATAGSPIRLCVTEYAGAANPPFDAHAVQHEPANNNSPGLENVSNLMLSAPPAGDLIYVAVFEGQDLPVTGGDGFDVHPSQVLDAVIEDTTTVIDPSRVVATIDSSSLAMFDAWVAFAAAIKPR